MKLRRQKIGFISGIAAFFLILLFTPVTGLASSLQVLFKGINETDLLFLANGTITVLALTVLMVIWWLSEPIPLSVTALLPAIVLPLFHTFGYSEGKLYTFTVKNVLVNYAHPVIYLFLAGFMFAAAFRKWELDRRITLFVLSRGKIAQSPGLIVLAMMSLAAFISMWISNTATAAMLIPIGLGIVSGNKEAENKSTANFSKAVLLGIAWGASIGGVGTIIGTPPNGICVSVLKTGGFRQITFAEWMVIGVPYVIVFLPLAWKILLKVFPFNPSEIELTQPAGNEQLKTPLSVAQKTLIAIFAATVFFWIMGSFAKDILPAVWFRQFEWIDENVIALFGAMLLFIVPVSLSEGSFILTWEDTGNIEWGTLLLFGGGIALSDALFRSGAALLLAGSISSIGATVSTFVLVLIIVFVMDFLTEITSNTAVTAMMLPVLIPVAQAAGANPVVVAIAASVGASMAFMLPVATPPNALVYGTGKIPLQDMVKAGFILDILGWLAASLIIYFLGTLLFG